MSILNKLQDQYDQLWKYIIRPTRAHYPEVALGPETFTLEDTKVKRNSFQLINDRGQIFYGSHFVPLEASSYPCVIYLHCNSSNQTEGMEYLSVLIKNNISLCTFDFAGCGNSEGDYVTLGYNQWRDLEEVVMHVKGKEKVTKIAIWGRSMGAVTALRYLAKNSEIVAGVFDSPFKSLKSLIGDLCKKNTKIPMFILSGALKIIASTIKEKANFDIYDLDPLKNEAPVIKTPGLFIVGSEDELVPPQHTKLLFEAYKSKKKYLKMVPGEHNTPRPEACINQIIKFLKKHLFKSEKGQQKTPQSGLKPEQIDFFNDDLLDSTNQPDVQQFTFKEDADDVDFFAQDPCSAQKYEDEFKQFENSNEGQVKSQQSTGTFSLNDIFSGVFGGLSKQKKPARPVNDGYEQLRKLVQTSITAVSPAQSQSRKQARAQIQKQLKSYDSSFEKMLAASPESFAW